MNKIIFALTTLISLNAYAASSDLLRVYTDEKNIRIENARWLSENRNEARFKIQANIIQMDDEGKLSSFQISEAIKNSQTTIAAIKYVHNNEKFIIKNTKCETTESCNNELYKQYVKKSDQIFLSKN